MPPASEPSKAQDHGHPARNFRPASLPAGAQTQVSLIIRRHYAPALAPAIPGIGPHRFLRTSGPRHRSDVQNAICAEALSTGAAETHLHFVAARSAMPPHQQPGWGEALLAGEPAVRLLLGCSSTHLLLSSDDSTPSSLNMLPPTATTIAFNTTPTYLRSRGSRRC
jgi:hypothetical protein